MMLTAAAMMLAGCPAEEPGGFMLGGGGGVPPSTGTPGTTPMEDMGMTPDAGEPGEESTTVADILATGTYEGWAAPNGPVEADPHGSSQAFLNPTLVASLRAGDEVHPVDSTIVLERYTPAGDLQGWSVMRKVEAGDDIDWFWYESEDPEDPGNFQVSGVGAPTCVGCHTNGLDFIQGVYEP